MKILLSTKISRLYIDPEHSWRVFVDRKEITGPPVDQTLKSCTNSHRPVYLPPQPCAAGEVGRRKDPTYKEHPDLYISWVGAG